MFRFIFFFMRYLFQFLKCGLASLASSLLLENTSLNESASFDERSRLRVKNPEVLRYGLSIFFLASFFHVLVQLLRA